MRETGADSLVEKHLDTKSECGNLILERLTESEKLLPISFPPMAIKDGSASIWTVFSSPYHHAARLGPPRLNPFATHTSRTFGEVNVVSELTALPMAGEVEFWHDDLPISEGGKFECCRGGILGEPCLYFLVPLTSNVIGNKDTSDPLCDRGKQRREECEIHICVSSGGK